MRAWSRQPSPRTPGDCVVKLSRCGLPGPRSLPGFRAQGDRRLIRRQARPDIKAGPHASDHKRGRAIAPSTVARVIAASPFRSPRSEALRIESDHHVRLDQNPRQRSTDLRGAGRPIRPQGQEEFLRPPAPGRCRNSLEVVRRQECARRLRLRPWRLPGTTLGSCTRF
jgi:hypothetical protein